MNCYIHPGYTIEPTFGSLIPEPLRELQYDSDTHRYVDRTIDPSWLYCCSQSWNRCSIMISNGLIQYPTMSRWVLAPCMAISDCIFTPMCLLLDLIWNWITGGCCCVWMSLAYIFACYDCEKLKFPFQCFYASLINLYNLFALCFHGYGKRWYWNWPISCLWSCLKIAEDPVSVGETMKYQLIHKQLELLDPLTAVLV